MRKPISIRLDEIPKGVLGELGGLGLVHKFGSLVLCNKTGKHLLLFTLGLDCHLDTTTFRSINSILLDYIDTSSLPESRD